MEGLGSFLLFAVLFYVMMRFGCGAHMVHGGHSEHKSHAGAPPDQHADPVCGVPVKPDEGYGRMYHGTLYRFCSRPCLDQFDADPDSYTTAVTSKGGHS